MSVRAEAQSAARLQGTSKAAHRAESTLKKSLARLRTSTCVLAPQFFRNFLRRRGLFPPLVVSVESPVVVASLVTVAYIPSINYRIEYILEMFLKCAFGV